MIKRITPVVLIALTLTALGCSKPSANTTAPATSTVAAPAQKTSAKTLPSAKVVPVPTDWVQMADEEKGYGFKVPEGTQSKTGNVNGVDLFMAKTPDPSSVAAIVMAFKDKTTSKEDLLKFASDVLEGMGEKDVKITDVVELSDDYSLGMISSVDEHGKVTKGKVLVATDVTDNYVMLLGTDEKEFAANEKIMDEIWGSFSMRSGGYSGNS
jgi:azurin